VTLVFAVYTAGVLAALLLAGRSSDQVGRRPVLAAAVSFSAVSSVVHILAPSFGWLFVGRILSGLSTGLVTGTGTAALTESGTNARRSSRVATAANMWTSPMGSDVAPVSVSTRSGPATNLPAAAVTAPAARHQPHDGSLRVLIGTERFSENNAWTDMPQHWPSGLADRVLIEVVGQGQLEARLVWVANMAGLNAVTVAEHALALLLALARRLLEAAKGFEPGRWGEPAGRSLAGTAACILGAGAVGTEIARRLAAFDVTVTGIRRHPPSGPSLPSPPSMAPTASSSASPKSTPSSSRPVIRPGSRPSSTTRCSDPCAAAPGSSTSPAAPSSTTRPPSPTSTPDTSPASGSTCSRPSPTPPTGHCSPTHASWRPPTPPRSPATTSQLPAEDSARPSPPTSIISHPPDCSGPPRSRHRLGARASRYELVIRPPNQLRELIDSRRLAHLTTINSDDSPQVSVIWIGLDGYAPDRESGMPAARSKQVTSANILQVNPAASPSMGRAQPVTDTKLYVALEQGSLITIQEEAARRGQLLRECMNEGGKGGSTLLDLGTKAEWMALGEAAKEATSRWSTRLDVSQRSERPDPASLVVIAGRGKT
jgi:hypothetical protein